MADDTRTLAATWVEYLKKNKGEPNPTESDYNTEFNREIEALLETLVADVTPGISHEKVRARLSDFRSRHQPLFHRIDRVRLHYVTRYRMWKVLADERRQHARAITIDHLKLFASRFAYAIMIAAVVLATGYFAKIFDIPLPMLRAVVP